MSGSLIKIDEQIVSTPVNSVNLTGMTSDYDVYVVQGNNISLDTDADLLCIRTLIDGTQQTASSYDKAGMLFKANTTFQDIYGINADFWYLDLILGTATQEIGNFTTYCFNFGNSSEYSFITMESTFRNTHSVLQGIAGGGIYKVAEAHNGIKYYAYTGNIDTNSRFVLYGLKK